MKIASSMSIQDAVQDHVHPAPPTRIVAISLEQIIATLLTGFVIFLAVVIIISARIL